jgi:UDP-glucose:(heptosyl)LPS alpha-1,3-glucosyltransferase
VRIALVIERVEPWRGGAETSTLELARLLARRGHDVHLVTATNCQSPPGLTIHRVPSLAALPALRTGAFVRNAMAFLRANPFDIVHAIAPVPSADVYQPRGGLLGETVERNVATRGSASRRLLKRALLAMNVKKRTLLDLERQIFSEGGPVIAAVSRYVARQCQRLYGLGPPRVRVIFNGVHLPLPAPEERAAMRGELRAQYHVGDATLLLLFVAHNFRLKGLDRVIDIVERLSSTRFGDFRLLVVGRDNPVRYQRRLEAARLDDRVLFTGPTQRAAAFYAAADVLLHPTYYDPCSRVVLEAVSCGLPCITTAYNGAAEVLTDGQNGYIVDRPEDLDRWLERIRALRDPEARRRISEAALGLRERISMARHVAELEELFVEVAGARAGRSCSAG